MTCIRNEEFWSYVPTFVRKRVTLLPYGIAIIGYFPYHTARLKISNPIQIPRDFFRDFEKILYKNHMQDNKAVYICRSVYKQSDHFAIMFKDAYCIIGDWSQVIQYDGKEIHEDATKYEEHKDLVPMSPAWPCTHCEVPDQDYCLNCCPLIKETNEKDRKEENSSAIKDAGNSASSSDSKPDGV